MTFFHIVESGKAQFQGQVLKFQGDSIKVQYFSWIDGAPTTIDTIPITNDLRLYSSHREFIGNRSMWAR
jgi:hypothetical protein